MSTQVAVTANVKEFADQWQPRYKYGKLGVTTGRVYHKIYSEDGAGGRSVVAFVDMQGNIYKPASWAKPAKHIRGNIFSQSQGLEALDSSGFIHYLR